MLLLEAAQRCGVEDAARDEDRRGVSEAERLELIQPGGEVVGDAVEREFGMAGYLLGEQLGREDACGVLSQTAAQFGDER